MRVYRDDWTHVYHADALEGLRALAAGSVHTCVTSPPYWGLRSYLPADHPDKALEGGAQQTPEEYVAWLVEVMRGVRRVLRGDGTLWLNIGDCFAGGGRGGHSNGIQGTPPQGIGNRLPPGGVPPGLKRKDLCMIPARVALALQNDGWYLRSEITWCKRAPMPESVTDRPTSATEKVYLLTKSARYFYDNEAVKEKAAYGNHPRTVYDNGPAVVPPGAPEHKGIRRAPGPEAGRNMRNYWLLGPSPYPGAHFATFPPDLVYPCIKAGTSERGVCEKCGAPWQRVMGESYQAEGRGAGNGFRREHRLSIGGRGDETPWTPKGRDTVGWQPSCACRCSPNPMSGPPETVPATVLDPFMGSGTTALAARTLGRRSVGFDLDGRNLALVKERLGAQGVLL